MKFLASAFFLLGALGRPASASTAVASSTAAVDDFTPMNTADLPGRCSADRLFIDFEEPHRDWSKFAAQQPSPDADEQAINLLLGTPNPDSPTAAAYLAKRTDYFRRRAEVQRKIEAKLARLEGQALTRGLDDYAYMLAYLGEFDKLTAYFGPGGPAARPQDGIVAFTLSHAYFRLGRYERSIAFGKKAYELLPNAALDTRWQLMTAELGLYGEDLYEKYSKKYYDLGEVQKLFVNRDRAQLPFEDVTARMKLDRWGGTGGISFVDLDGDGWDDLLIQRKFFPSRVYKNLQGKGFAPVPDADIPDKWCNDIVQSVADYDNDGKPDLQRHCCNYDGPGPSTLLKNLGSMKFKDVTKASGLDYRSSGMHMAWADFDMDGNLDVVVADQWGPVRLWRNKGDGTFEDATKKAGVISPGGGPDDDFGAVGCSFGDYDSDGYPDLSCNGWTWSRLWHNNGDGTFTDVTEKAGIDLGKTAIGYISFWTDYDNDGKLDLFVGRYVVNSGEKWGWGPRCTCSNLLAPEGFSEREWTHGGTLYHNNGDGTFTDMTSTVKFIPLGVMGANAGDWNNDGCEDIVMGAGGPYLQQAEPYLFYQNNCDGTFKLITPFTMRSLWGKGHGNAFGDYDHDGNLDLYVNIGGAFPGDAWPSMLLHNKGSSNHWLELALKGGKGTNRFAVGAQVEAWAGKLHVMRELASGGRFSATNTLRVHLGLAANAKIDRLVVRWPNKRKHATELRDIPADRALELDEETGALKVLWASPRPGTAPPKIEARP